MDNQRNKEMELKTIIKVSGSQQGTTLHENEKSLRDYLSRFFPNAYKNFSRHPILVLERCLKGDVDGYRILSTTHSETLPFYISEDCKISDGKVYVSNAVKNTTNNHISNGYTVVNQAGKQLYPKLKENQESALDKYIRESFGVKYKFIKQKTK